MSGDPSQSAARALVRTLNSDAWPRTRNATLALFAQTGQADEIEQLLDRSRKELEENGGSLSVLHRLELAWAATFSELARRNDRPEYLPQFAASLEKLAEAPSRGGLIQQTFAARDAYTAGGDQHFSDRRGEK
ncbi:hypothetical protein GCM10028775_21390 [Catellatospora paridis]